MKKLIISSLLALLSLSLACATPTTSHADSLARDGKFPEATDAYEAILASGNESADLYYNLGYSYFKQGMLAKAIINFERSRRLNPSDPDVIENLSQAYALTDKLQVLEPMLITRLWNAFRDSLSSNGWAVAFVILFALTLTGIGLFLFMDSVALRKTGFFSATILALLAIVALSISLNKRSEILNSDDAIIMVSSATLATSPDKNATEMAVLHEGTPVHIIDYLGDWAEVRLKDGNVGWLLLSNIEKI